MKNWWFIVLVLALLALGCTSVVKEKPQLNELQETACNAAGDHNTCDKLPDLELVTPEDCCAALNKCC